MAVTYDAGTVGETLFGTNPSASFSHTTPAGSNRVLVLLIGIDDTGGSLSTVTYNGVGLTQHASAGGASPGRRNFVYYLIDPPTGANTVVVTWTGDAEILAFAASFSGAHQTTPLGTAASATATSTAPSIEVASGTDDLVIDLVHTTGDPGLTEGGGQTQREVESNQFSAIGVSTGSGVGSVTMSWTLGLSVAWTHIGVCVKAPRGPMFRPA